MIRFIFPIKCKNIFVKKCFLASCYIEITVLYNNKTDNKIHFWGGENLCKSIIVDIKSKYVIW